jgi:DNA-binding transcriptional MerR regulator
MTNSDQERQMQNDFERELIRFAEVVEITGLEAGLIKGWQQRGLWKYQRREHGSGVHRLYSFVDLVGLTIVAELTSFGVSAGEAWHVARDQAQNIADGVVLSLAVYRDQGRFAYSGSNDVFTRIGDLLKNLYAIEKPKAVIVINAGAIKSALLKKMGQYFQPLTTASSDDLQKHMDRTASKPEPEEAP